MTTYINDLEQLAVGIKDEHFVLASLRQQNVVLHHQRNGTTIFRLCVVEILKDGPLCEDIAQLAQSQRSHLRDPVVCIVTVVALKRVPRCGHVGQLLVEVSHGRIGTLKVRLHEAIVLVYHSLFLACLFKSK